MSWNITVVGRDKEKLKAAVRAQQCQDEEKSPHNGVPVRVVNYLCAEIDRVRIYQYPDRTFGLEIKAWGSFHEQGSSETINVAQVQMIE